MKASDICVGDWLNIYTFPNDNPKEDDLFPAKVSAVSIFEPFKEPDDVIVELVIERTKGIASIPLNTCLLIELTEEILVKNGFEQNGNLTYVSGQVEIIKHRDNWNVVINKYCVFVDMNIKFVHQLQHLLRLCGIEKKITL